VTVALPILADSSVESAETFSVVATSASAGSLKKATGTVTIDDSDTTVSTSGELDSLAADVVSDLATDIGAALLTAYQTAATSASQSLSATSSDITTAAAAVTPGLTTGMKAFYGIVAAEITSAVSSNSAAADFAQALMTANSATKLFDPSTIIGTYINGNGTYIGSNDLSSLTAAIQSEYDTFKTYAVETVGDVFGTDTAANFAGAVVNMLTTGNDKETLTSASEIIPTFDGTDTVYAAAGNDKIIGGSGVDTFYGQDGNDHLYGYRGNDVLDGGDGNDRIVGGLGDDTISGGAGNDYVLAQGGDDTISIGTGTDEVLGGSGDDVITVDGVGNKTIDGGTGTDTLSLTAYSWNDFATFKYHGVDASGYLNGFKSGGSWTWTTSGGNTIDFSNIENVSVGGVTYTIQYSNGDGGDVRGDIHNASGRTGGAIYSTSENKVFLFDNSVNGNGRTNFTNADTDDVTIKGSNLQDFIISSSDKGSITANAGDGNDEIDIRNGKSDTIYGEGGNDIIYINGSDLASDTLLDGGDGSDWLAFGLWGGGSAVNYTLNSGVTRNFENIVGSGADDTLTGDVSQNSLHGGKGNDTILGGAGDDLLYGDITKNGTGSVYQMDNGVGQGPAYGHNDTGNDTLRGQAGNDTLYGAGGDDELDGGTGKDTITTGSGSDQIILRAGDGGDELSDADIITDFTDGSDDFGLTTSLSFGDLTRTQGSGDYANDTIIKYGSEYLAILQNIDVSLLTEADFEDVDFA
jgi:Ca2+-binding RTX toxin-like protein